MRTAAILVLLAAACVATTNAGAHQRQASSHTNPYRRNSADLKDACMRAAWLVRHTILAITLALTMLTLVICQAAAVRVRKTRQ